MSLEKYINKKKTAAVIDMIRAPVRRVIKREIETETVVSGKFKTITSAKTVKEINHKIVDYNDKKYIVCYTRYKENDVLFIVDYSKINVINKSWHYRTDGGYIASPVIDINDDNRKELYLHNFVMNRLTHDGKGQHHTIDHINRIGRDNRIENLRLLSQSHQNINQSKRERNVVLPEDSDIDPNDIPKNIYYKAGSGAHGDLFYIEIKTPEIIAILNPVTADNPVSLKYKWFGTKSKTLDLRVKLEQAINKLEELRALHPSIADLIYAVDNVEERNALTKSFNDILGLSGYPEEIIIANQVQEEKEHVVAPITQVQEQIAQEIKDKTIRGFKSHLPENCGVQISMIPKYCYYKPASDTRGDKFVIDRHPTLVQDGKRMWSTTESKKVTTLDKYNLMIVKMTELDGTI